MTHIGFIKFMRTFEARDILKHPREFVLLALIAQRARWSDSTVGLLGQGEAFIGDYAECGLSRQQYRTALKNLERWGMITTKSTNKGTIVKLINSDIFDINCNHINQQVDQQPANIQPSDSHPAASNKKERRKRREIKSNSKKQIFCSMNEKSQRASSKQSDCNFMDLIEGDFTIASRDEARAILKSGGYPVKPKERTN